jgi:hypothetical protein
MLGIGEWSAEGELIPIGINMFALIKTPGSQRYVDSWIEVIGYGIG